jgi:hypothetical protein
MSKAIKPKVTKKVSAKKKSTSRKPPLKKVSVSRSSLVAISNATSQIGTINAVFKNGLGQITAILYRKGVEINKQTISQSGNIIFSDVQSGDAVAINGVCSGSASISIDLPASPDSPITFNAEHIFTGFTIH